MKQITARIFAIVLLFGIVTATTVMAGKNTIPKPVKIDGLIAEINTTNGTVSVQCGIGAPLNFKVPANATIAITGKRKAVLSDLKVGDKVTVAYTATTNDLIVVKIGPVTPQKTKPKKNE